MLINFSFLAVPFFPPYEPILTNLNPDSVVLSWQPATLPSHTTHMPSVTYRIEIQDPPERGHWRTYASNVPKTSYHVTNLRPDRDYLFRIRAEADNTMTEPSMAVYLPRRACELLIHILNEKSREYINSVQFINK